MRRHTPTLFPHPEQDVQQADDTDEADEADWDLPRPHPYSTTSLPTSSSSHRTRIGPRVSHSVSSKLNTNIPSSDSIRSTPRYSDIYSQFVQRYRSQPDIGDDPYNDPDSHYFHKNLGELVDTNSDEDEDDPSHISTVGQEFIDRMAVLALESESTQSTILGGRERLEWQTMLASVLDGDVLKSEKTRITFALESSADEQSSIHLNIWLGIRARFHGTSEEEERKTLEEQRLHMVDAVIEEIMSFRVDSTDGHDATFALKQVNALMRRLDMAQSLYPSIKAFHLDKAANMHPEFQARCDTLNTWSTVLTSLRRHITLLRQWTGSDTLDVTQPNTNAEVAIGSNPAQFGKDGHTEIADRTSFVERVLKEESMQRTFEKGFLTTVHSFISTARDAQVNLSVLFKEMNLPTFENELVPLISFPTKLAQAGLCVLLDYVQKLKDPDVLIIDQLTEDLKLNIGLACTLKRQYEAFLAPDPGGNWNLPQCISEDYDSTILEALSIFFRLIHWKLKSGVKGIYFKETDVLEAHWATFSDVSMTTPGGSQLVAQQLCTLTNKLLIRVTNYFETQVRVPISGDLPAGRIPNSSISAVNSTFKTHPHSASSTSRKMTDEQMVRWYSKVLDSVRWRYRKLQRFARVLTQIFSNSAEFNLEDVALERFISHLVATDHFLVYTQSFEEEGTYIVAASVLGNHPEAIRRMLTEAFHVNEIVANDGIRMEGYTTLLEDDYESCGYLLLLSPRSQFLWNGLVLMLDIPKVDLDLKDNRVRLIADGPQGRLLLAKQRFTEIFLQGDEDGESTEFAPLPCLADQQAHLPLVNRELRKIARATNRLAESIVDSVHHVRSPLRAINDCKQLLENWYLFASEHGQHAQKYMDHSSLVKFNRLLMKLAISWVSFICDDCDPTDRKTFKSAVNALEFTLHWTRRNSILQLPDEQFEMLRQKVAGCMTLLVSHFDILGARSTTEARREKEKQDNLLRKQASNSRLDDATYLSQSLSSDNDDSPFNSSPLAYTDSSVRLFWEKAVRSIHQLEGERAAGRTVGRVLDDEKPEDRSLVFLASLNIQIQWQQGRFIGAGAFGSVYLAVNLDSGSLMAVKEIKFQELPGLPNLYSQIKDELGVMQLLHHPNVVEYYGIEVHRDRVYIFEEYCQGGSLAALLEHGRIEDERIIQAYTMQMLEGLAYLHSNGIVHRDIKPDNILLDHMGVIKYVDFGAAKILAKNQRTIQQRSRRGPDTCNKTPTNSTGVDMHNSLTGTPMYMSPEIIKNDKCGRYGAMDVWSLGCVVLEFATGKKPWSNLDNEWAIMFHIGVATQHPPLPEPGQLSDLGINFIKQCLTIDPMKRPTAVELMDHSWMLEFRETLLRYEEAEIVTSPPSDMPMEETSETATVARRTAIMKKKELENIHGASPSISGVETPSPVYETSRQNSFLLPP